MSFAACLSRKSCYTPRSSCWCTTLVRICFPRLRMMMHAKRAGSYSRVVWTPLQTAYGTRHFFHPRLIWLFDVQRISLLAPASA